MGSLRWVGCFAQARGHIDLLVLMVVKAYSSVSDMSTKHSWKNGENDPIGEQSAANAEACGPWLAGKTAIDGDLYEFSQG